MKRAFLIALCLALAAATAGAGNLTGQSIGKAIDRAFPARDISYVLLNGRTGEVVAARWPDVSRPVAAGSLVKPFAALAYFEAYRAYPRYECSGSASQCWYPSGHGRIAMAEAIEFSCNSYFRVLAGQVRAEDLFAVARRFGIAPPARSSRSDSFFGAGDGWQISPVALLHAYLELDARQAQPGVRELVDGMESAAISGTAKAASHARPGERLLAKTGTAPCAHSNKAPGDGFVILLSDRVSPRFALLVRQHGRPGAEAAAVAGEILRTALGK